MSSARRPGRWSDRAAREIRGRFPQIGVLVLTEALARIDAGETVLDPEIVRRLLTRPRNSSPLDELTDRDREVLALMAEGHTNPKIAERLVISVRTVETHVASILLKLGISTAAEGHPRVLAVLAYLRRVPIHERHRRRSCSPSWTAHRRYRWTRSRPASVSAPACRSRWRPQHF